MNSSRRLFFYKAYFSEFYDRLTPRVKRKIVWTLNLIKAHEIIPEIYLKHLTGTEGLYEIRVQIGRDIFRIFCFFDSGNIIVIGNGFQKKTQKTPTNEIERAKKIRNEYYEERKSDGAGRIHRSGVR